MDDNPKSKPEGGEPDAGSTSGTSKTPKQIYFELLRAWVQHAQMQQQIQAFFPYYLMNNYPQLFQANGQFPNGSTAGSGVALVAGQTAANGTGTAVVAGNQNQVQAQNANQRRGAETLDPARQEEIINRNGGYEYVIAPLWKRFVAEAIDIIIIFLLKVMTTMAFIDFFDINLLDIDFDAIRNSIEEDYTELLHFTSELIFLEIIIKLAVCVYETMWTIHGQGQIGGATPGKMLMGIRIVHVEAVVLLEPPQPGFMLNNQNPIKALLYPATNPGFKRALCRSVAKNALIVLFFPMCFLMFFKHNRTMYDILTKTIVVEDNPAPVLRRR
ncbi:protein FAM8A1 [Toxorhynchites rutilus septentrionalis]|uniref:protein FAM8A1 n=1 Tax=Toxorhynchites rutilus septentrionalis TaxID=329112 RepID=UPI00247B17E1|nr:protein FAM8A1 [Toxorhynchites rutilus septentrionalis]